MVDPGKRSGDAAGISVLVLSSDHGQDFVQERYGIYECVGYIRRFEDDSIHYACRCFPTGIYEWSNERKHDLVVYIDVPWGRQREFIKWDE